MRVSAVVLLVLSGCVGCVGEIGQPTTPPPQQVEDPPPGPDPDPDPPPPMPDPIPTVPATIAALAATSTCTALEPFERVLAVSAEGHVWLATTTIAATTIRVLDGWDPTYETRTTLPFAAIDHAQAWTATTASMIADRALWHIEDGERIAITLPAALDAGASLCGDPSRRAFVLSGTSLFQRIDDAWWSWSGIDRAIPGGGSLLARDGECAGDADRVWITTSTLAFWSLTPASISNPALLEGGTHPALRGDDLLALHEGLLFIGPEPWSKWQFEQGDARLLAAAGTYAWIVAGDRLIRFDGEIFTDAGPATELRALHPHASGGLWFETASSICHVAPDPMLRVHGLRNGEERATGDFVLRARATREDMNLVAKIDGVELEPSAVEDQTFVFSGALEVGWHEVQLTAPNGLAVRSLAVKRLPSIERSFETDIRPIYQSSCAGSACHDPNSTANAPDFSRYEVWLERSEKVRERIVQRRDMPPLASRGPDWSEDQVAIINEWLNGGLRP